MQKRPRITASSNGIQPTLATSVPHNHEPSRSWTVCALTAYPTRHGPCIAARFHERPAARCVALRSQPPPRCAQHLPSSHISVGGSHGSVGGSHVVSAAVAVESVAVTVVTAAVTAAVTAHRVTLDASLTRLSFAACRRRRRQRGQLNQDTQDSHHHATRKTAATAFLLLLPPSFRLSHSSFLPRGQTLRCLSSFMAPTKSCWRPGYRCMARAISSLFLSRREPRTLKRFPK